MLAVVAAHIATALLPHISRWDSPLPPHMRSTCDERFFDQPVDHFAPRRPPGQGLVWKQRYIVCRTDLLARSEGAPILFYAGNEADVELYVNATGLMWEHADELGAALVWAEHRYFGKSMPFARATLRRHMEFLSSEQALADFAQLLHFLRGPPHSRRPAAALGGSYGGMLASWLRIKYPSAIDGALAASAPILSFLGLDPPYEVGSFGASVTYDASAAGGATDSCAAHIRSAWRELFDVGRTEAGRARLFRLFRLCPDSKLLSSDHVEQLAFWIQSAFDFMAMGSFPYASSYMLNGQGSLPPFPMREACRRIEASAASGARGALLAALRDGASVFYNYTDSPAAAAGCFDLSVTGNNETTIDGELWDYLFCSDMLQPASRDGVADMFWPQSFNLTATTAGCQIRWRVRPRPEWPVVYYGGWAALESASNLFFSNGELDPWRGGGVTRNVSESVRAHVIPGVGHHIDLFFSHDKDPPAVRAVRRAEVDAIKRWFAEATPQQGQPP